MFMFASFIAHSPVNGYDAWRIFGDCYKLNAVALPFLDRVELGYIGQTGLF